MIQRRVVIPAEVGRLWRALTDPEEAGRWLGGRLEWTPEEGGGLRFLPDGGPGEGRGTGAVREGRVEEIVPGRYMRFVWWPAEGGPADASEVEYSLEPVVPGSGGSGGSGSSSGGWGSSSGGTAPATILTVEEAPAPASASASGSASGSASAAAWTGRDEIQWRMWASREMACLVGG